MKGWQTFLALVVVVAMIMVPVGILIVKSQDQDRRAAFALVKRTCGESTARDFDRFYGNRSGIRDEASDWARACLAGRR